MRKLNGVKRRLLEEPCCSVRLRSAVCCLRLHRRSSALLITVLASGCDNIASGLDRARLVDPIVLSRLGAPVSFDTSLVKLRLADLKLIIPANCLDAQVTPKSIDGAGFTIDSDLLIAVILPILQCRSRASRKEYERTGHTEPRVSILVASLIERLTATDVLSRLYRPASRNNEIVGIDQGSTTLRLRAARGPPNQGADDLHSRTALSTPNKNGFTVCTGYGQVPVRQCRTTFLLGPSVIIVKYAADHVRNRDKLGLKPNQRVELSAVR